MNKIYTFTELKESRLIYDRKPPLFGVFMTLLTLAFLIGALLWAALSTKTYVVKATALIDNENKTNVMNSVSGKIKSICVSEGQQINEDDTILILDSMETELQIAQLQAMVDLYDGKVTNTQKLIDFVNNYELKNESTQTNPFDSKNAETAKLYADAESFKSYVNQLKQQKEEEGEEYKQADLDSLKIQFLSQQTYSELNEHITQKAQYMSQLEMYEKSLAAYTVRALQKGVIHLSAGITEGTVIQAGTLLGNITDGDSDKLYFNAVVSATERSKLEIGSSVEIAVSGAMQTEYGTLNGKIISIDYDSTQTEDGQVFYRVKIDTDKYELTDKAGHSVKLQLGMIGECRIKYDETTYLNWMIEQIVGKLY